MLFYELADGEADVGADGEWRGDGTRFSVATSTISMRNASRLQKLPVYLRPKFDDDRLVHVVTEDWRAQSGREPTVVDQSLFGRKVQGSSEWTGVTVFRVDQGSPGEGGSRPEPLGLAQPSLDRVERLEKVGIWERVDYVSTVFSTWKVAEHLCPTKSTE